MTAINMMEVRRAIWERDGGICQICREPVAFDSLMHADHIVSKLFGGTDDLDNFQTSHRACNIRKGNGQPRSAKPPRAMPEKVEIRVWGYRCERCAHEWVPLRDHAPRVCPKCKSPYWDIPTKRRTRARRAAEGEG